MAVSGDFLADIRDSALIQQPRFKPQDLALAYAEDVYSRFLVSPVRYANGRDNAWWDPPAETRHL